MYALREYVKKWLVFIPVIHRYRPWDYSYILEVNRACLKQTQKAVFKDGHGLYTLRQERDMRAALVLLDRLIEDEYVTGKSSLVKTPEGYYTVKGDVEFHRSVKTAALRKKSDLNLLMNIYSKRLFSWWD